MSTPVVSSRGIVVSIWGKAYIRGADGAWRPLKVGELVKPSDQLLTEQNGIVQMEPADTALTRTGTVPAEGVDRAIAALGTREGAPAAGLVGGDGGDLQPGLRVERIVESLGVAPSVNPTEAVPLNFGRAAASTGAPELDSPPPVTAGSSAISAVEEGGAVNLGLVAPTGGGTLSVTVTQVPAIGQIVTAGGAVVAAGAVLTPADVAGLLYLPPADYNGVAPVGGFAYTVSNGTSAATGTVLIGVTAVNDTPLATAGSVSGAEDGALGVSLAGTDVDGTIAAVRVTTLPAHGTLLLADGVTPVLATQALTSAQAASLIFVPLPHFNGNASLAFTVTDNNGAVSTPATFALGVNPVNDAPVAVNDTVSTVGSAPVTVAVLANDSDIDGDALRLLGANVNPALGAVVVNADGTLTFTAAPGVSGPVVVGYSAFDPSGAVASATLTVNVAGAPSITVDGPALSNDSTPLLGGTSNAPPGSTITLTVTGANGAVQTFTTTVQPDGTYSASVPSALAEGAYSVTAAVTVGGNTASASDGGSIDTSAPTITVDAPALGNDSTPTITGTTDLPPGATVTLTVTGANGAVQSFTATVQAGGGYSADVPSALAQGAYTVVATGTDAAGNTGSASDAGVLDTTPPMVTVDGPALTNDTTPAITGTTDLPAGSTVTLTVTDANGVPQTFTATVQAGGSFSADVPNPLAQGAYTVRATATDAAGNSATANDGGSVDSVPPAPTITLDAAVTADDVINAAEAGGDVAITGSVGGDARVGDTVTLTVNGKTFSGTVAAGLTFSIPVPGSDLVADADRVIDASVATTDAAGNGASATDTEGYAVDLAPPALTVDAPALTNDATPTITGTTDLPAGSTVTLLVTDAGGVVQTFTATVQAGGSYSADVPNPLAQGAYTVAAAAADAAGNPVAANDNGVVDSVPPAPTITLDANVTADDVINAAESGASIAITGSVGGDAKAGDTVTLTVNGNTFTGTVAAGLTFSIAVPGAALVADADRVIDASVTTTDTAGNSASATATEGYGVDVTAPAASIAIDAITGDDIVNAGEAAGSIAITGSVGGDVKAGDTVTLTVNGNTYTGAVQTGGSFSIAVLGADVLADADRMVDASVTTTDAAGNSSTASGTRAYSLNTAPVAVADTANVGEDAPSVAGDATPGTVGQDRDADGDALTVVGVAAGVLAAASGNVGSGVAGSYGTLTLAADGSWTYVPGAAAQALPAGQTGVDTFTYTIGDGRGGSATTTLTVDVAGSNDAATLSGGVALLAEDIDGTRSGTLAINDPDAGQNAFVAQTGTVGAFGTFAIDSAGAWTFTLDNASPAVQALAVGATVFQSFAVTSVDGTATAVNVTVTGTNDAPTVAAAAVAVNEDSATSGTLTGNDIDSGEAATLAFALTGAAPAGFALSANGSWTFDAADAAYQSLAAGQQLVLTIPYTATDAQSATSAPADLVITVTGTDDAPVISAGSGSVVEDTQPSATGTLTATDADNPGLAFVAGTTAGSHGSLVLAANGAWTYALGAAAQALTQGQQVTDTITVGLTDGSTTTVAINVTGTNDVPVASAASASATEDGALTSGSVAATDADAGESATLVYALTGAAPAGLVFNADGSYSFDPTNAAYQSLAAGQPLVLTIPFVATDIHGAASAPADLVVTVTGTNDAPVASAAVASAVEDGAVVNGSVGATDTDSGETATLAYALTGAAPAGLVFNADGSYSFDPANAAYQALTAGQQLVLTVPYTATDANGAVSNTATLTITVTGTDDLPVISTGSGSTIEDTQPSASGTLTATDADNPTLAFVAGTTAGNYGSLALAANGAWTYALGAAAQALAGGQVVTDTITVGLNDGRTTTVTITVTGTDDAPVVSAGTGSVTEDSQPAASGTLTATDIDGPAPTFVAGTQASAFGSFSVNAAGQWTYTLGAGAQALRAGQVVTETYTVGLSNGGTTTVTMTLNGTNDVPVASAATNSATEDSPVISGSVSATDADSGETATLVYALAGAAPAGFVFNADGSYSFDPGVAAYQSLAAGQQLVLTIPYRATDVIGAVSNTADLVITVTGTDDAPIISAGTGSVVEDTQPSTTGTLSASDADNPGLAFVAGTTAGSHGSLALSSAGAWTYTLGAAAQALTQGQQVTDTITVNLTDGSMTTVAITVTGTNDVPTVAAASGALDEDSTLTGTLAGNDADSGETATLAFALTGAAPAGFSLNANGNWSFDASHAAYQALAQGQQLVLTLPYTATDANGAASAPADLVITVTGTNDAPVAVADAASTPFNTPISNIVVLTNDSDPDAGAVLQVTGASVAATSGTVSVNPDGTVNFTPAPNVSGPVAISYTLSDGIATTVGTLTVTVGANTPPAGTDKTVSLAEDTSVTFAAADFGFSDADLGQTLAAVRIDSLPAGGTLTLGGAAVSAGQVIAAAALGTLAFTPAAHATGAPYANFTFSVQDSAGGFDPTPNTITIDVTPVADAAVIDGPTTGNVVEDGVLVASGQLTVTDPDAGQAAFQPLTAGSALGSFTIAADGAWSYTLVNASAQNLRVGDQVVESFTVTTIDGTQTQIDITITGTNDGPVAQSAVAGATEDGAAIAGSLVADDADFGETASLVYALTGAAPEGFALGNGGSWTFDPTHAAYQSLAAGQQLVLTIPYRATDVHGALSNIATLTITVTGTNDAPMASNDGTAALPFVTVAEDSGASAPIAVLANDTDPDGDALTVTTASSPNGTVTINPDNTLAFTPAANFSGATTISYSVSDGRGGSSTATVFVNVTPVNDAPQTNDVAASGSEDAAARIPVALAGSDIDGTVASFTITGLPANGALYAAASGGAPLALGAVVSGPVYFVPAPNFNGSTSFQYAATDNGGATDATPATATITISAVNDAPVNSLPASHSATEDTTTAITGLSIADVDAASGSMTVTLSVTNGTLTVSGGGAAIAGSGTGSVALTGTLAAINATLAATVNYVPSANYNGSVTLAMVTQDNGNTGSGGALSDSDNLVFNVAAVNDAPASTTDSAARVEGGSTSGFLNVLANDSDVEGSALTVGQVATSAGGVAVNVNGVSTISTALGGTVVMNTDGTFRYIAPVVTHDAANTALADSFVYKASDGTGLGTWTTVTLNLSDTTPTGTNDSANVAFNGTVGGNLLVNDSSVDALRVSSFTFGSTTVAVPAGGSNSIDTAGGLLTVNADGSYSYTSQLPSTKVLTGSSLAIWENSTNLYGFTSGTPFAGSNLNLNSLTAARQAQAVEKPGSKFGIGVGTSGSGTVDGGEALVINMLETTTSVVIGIAQLNTNQNPANALWKAFDASGNQVASGNFTGATSTSNGSEYTLTINQATAFQYITLEWVNNSQGFVLSSLDLTRNPANYVETFSYVATDADGDTTSASFTVTPASSSAGGSTTITGTAGDDTTTGTAAAETFNAGNGHDVVRSGGGVDSLNGGDGADYLDGGAGNDAIDGGTGNDILVGGAGNDALAGGAGADVFVWRLGDTGADTIANFDSAAASSGGDVIDLRDLLQGETTTASLDNYLDFSFASGSTTIGVKSTGGGSADQTITLANVDLRSTLGLGGTATDAQLIAELINRGKLATDVPPGG